MNNPQVLPEIKYIYTDEKKLEFELIDIEHISKRKFKNHNPLEPHRVNFYIVICFEEGNGKHNIDFVGYPFKAGTFITIYPGQVHTWDFSSKPKGKVFVFSEKFVDQLSANTNLPFNNKRAVIENSASPIINPDCKTKKQLNNLIENIDFVQNQAVPNLILAMHLYLSFYILLDSLRPSNLSLQVPSKQQAMLYEFIELLQKNCQYKRDASWYAEQLCTTYKTLNEVSKKSISQTAKQLIDDYVITEIKRQLATTSVPIQTLCFEFNFQDLSNFIKYFKKRAKMTPSQFQKQYNIKEQNK